MLWGATVRSPHPRARIVSVDIAPALAITGVHAALVASDIPGNPRFGQKEQDQPVLADGEVRFWGEAVCVVAADDREAARRAAAAVVVTYEPLEPLTDPEEAVRRGEAFRTLEVVNGDQAPAGRGGGRGLLRDRGQQDQAMLGTESGLAVPDGEGGVDLYISTQWMHVDHRQIVACLGLRPEQVRLHLAGIGGAFGAREDLTLQIHLCLLALHTGRPVKMVYDRAESFAGHVHRHPARLWYRHEADRQGNLVRVEARLILDGGAYEETSGAVVANSAYFAVGPYRCPSVRVDAVAARTNNPPAGAMRGFGANQVCFAYEAQMDRLAAALGIDPIELRLRNALGHGDRMPTTGQEITGSLPTAEVIRSARRPAPARRGPGRRPPPPPRGPGPDHPARRGAPRHRLRRGHQEHLLLGGLRRLRRGPGGAHPARPGGAHRRRRGGPGHGHRPAPDRPQRHRHPGGGGGLRPHRADRLGRVHLGLPPDPDGRRGRPGGLPGPARRRPCERGGGDRLDDAGVWRGEELVATLDDLLAAGPLEHHTRFRHAPTEEPNATGQGNLHAGFCVAAHRAVVDVDPELGLVRVVRVDTAQDVGRALNPLSVLGQIEGGILQGVGLAIMEELLVDRGVVRNASFTDYLIPTILDAPDVEAVIIEDPEPGGPFGAKGFAELPTISSTPAVVAAIRAATGRPLNRVPVRPQDIAGV